MEMDIKPSADVLRTLSAEAAPSESGDVKAFIIPAKLPLNHRMRQAGQLRVAVNGYELDLTHAIEKVYKHELKIVGVKEDGKEKDLTRGPKNDIAATLRRRVLWSICSTFIHSDPSFFGTDTKKLFYDCGINFYSIDKLIDRSEGEREFRLEVAKLSENSRDFLGVKTKEVVGRLLACEEVYLHDTAAVSDRISERERSVIQFLEIATTQKMYYEQDHLIFGNKMYEKGNGRNEMPLKDGKVLSAGLEKNVRFIGDSWEGAVPMLQIDAKKSAFFRGGSVLELVEQITRTNPRAIIQDQRLKQRVAKQLKDLVVRTTYMPQSQRTFCAYGITSEPANQLGIVVDGQEVSVADYFYHKYNCRLRHPELPCIIERRISAQAKQVMNSFFPMECLEVVKGQRVSIKKQTPELVDELIQACRLMPSQLMGENERQRQSAHIDNNNPYLHKLGISVVNRPKSSEALVLFPPAILYGNSKVEPGRNGEMDWRLSVPRGMQNRLFFRPATRPRKWVVFRFPDAVDNNSFNRFVSVLTDRAQHHGLSLGMPTRKDDIDRTDLQFITERMNNMRKGYVEFVLFLTREKKDPVHDVMKLCEVRCNVITQHVHSKTALKAISNRGAEMVLDNILMKTNLKLGGLTHTIATAGEFMNRNRVENLIERQWLRTTRMFIGLDMSHSSPQSLYERQAAIPPSEPTVVGMCYSCGDAFTMRGEYWMQEPRKATILFLKEHVEMAVKAFKDESQSKSLPEHVVVFRGGVSEGEFAKVMIDEANAIRAAFKAAAEGRPSRIRLSILVVQANSNYRMFPEQPRQGNAAAQNVQAGTVVDSGCVHPTHTEFLLVPHRSIMGTARPIRCTLLVDDEPRMSMDELEGVTNALCYMHGIVTSPVSMPAHLYAASELAKRGRNNWKTANFGDDEGSMASGEEGGRYRNDGSETFFPSMSADLAPKARHKFWA